MNHVLNSILSILKCLRIYFEFTQDRENLQCKKDNSFFIEDDALL